MDYFICKAKPVASRDKEIQCMLWSDSGPQTISYTGPGYCPAALQGQESYFKASFTTEYSTHSQKSLVSVTKESGQP